MFNFKDYKMTGNVAVDMVAACVLFYRKRKRALKTIFLSPYKYQMFREWVIKEYGEEAAKTMRYEFDSVHIDLGSIFQKEALTVEFWPEAINN